MIQQIAVVQEGAGDSTQLCLFALDSEGNIWRLDEAQHHGFAWAQPAEWHKITPPPISFNDK